MLLCYVAQTFSDDDADIEDLNQTNIEREESEDEAEEVAEGEKPGEDFLDKALAASSDGQPQDEDEAEEAAIEVGHNDIMYIMHHVAPSLASYVLLFSMWAVLTQYPCCMCCCCTCCTSMSLSLRTMTTQ